MKDKHQAHNLIVLDESGSMVSIKEATIRGFNEIVQTIRAVEKQFPGQEHFISFVSFNSLATKTHLWCEPVAQLQALDDSSYEPAASTPLFDALERALLN